MMDGDAWNLLYDGSPIGIRVGYDTNSGDVTMHITLSAEAARQLRDLFVLACRKETRDKGTSTRPKRRRRER